MPYPFIPRMKRAPRLTLAVDRERAIHLGRAAAAVAWSGSAERRLIRRSRRREDSRDLPSLRVASGWIVDRRVMRPDILAYLREQLREDPTVCRVADLASGHPPRFVGFVLPTLGANDPAGPAFIADDYRALCEGVLMTMAEVWRRGAEGVVWDGVLALEPAADHFRQWLQTVGERINAIEQRSQMRPR